MSETFIKTVKRKQRKYKALLERRMDCILAGQWSDVVNSFLSLDTQNYNRPHLSSNQKVKKARTFISAGQVGDALRILESTGPAPDTEATRSSLAELLPQEAEDRLNGLGVKAQDKDYVTGNLLPYEKVLSNLPAEDHPYNSTEKLYKYWDENLDQSKVRQALHSSQRHKSTGAGGFSTDCLKDLIMEVDQRTATDDEQRKHSCPLRELCRLGTHILAGAIPSECSDILRVNTLVATSKANGGIRPIGIGEALRRFVCRLSLTVLKDPLEELLHPTQFCAGTKGGLAAVANMQRLFHEKDTNAITVQTDVKNAFGSVSWTMLFRAVDTYAPMLSGILRVLYKDKSCLYIGLPQVRAATLQTKAFNKVADSPCTSSAWSVMLSMRNSCLSSLMSFASPSPMTPTTLPRTLTRTLPQNYSNAFSAHWKNA